MTTQDPYISEVLEKLRLVTQDVMESSALYYEEELKEVQELAQKLADAAQECIEKHQYFDC